MTHLIESTPAEEPPRRDAQRTAAGGRPRVSFVAAGRNDPRYVETPVLQKFINTLAEQCERHALAGELVLVDWNPPSGRPNLADLVCWPQGSAVFRAKVIEAPRSTHIGLPNGRALPFFPWRALNAGVRRADGDIIACMTADVMLSDALFASLQALPSDGQFFVLAPEPPATSANRGRSASAASAAGVLEAASAGEDLRGWATRPLAPTAARIAALLSDLADPAGAVAATADESAPCPSVVIMPRTGWTNLTGFPEWPVGGDGFVDLLVAQAQSRGWVRTAPPPDARVDPIVQHGAGTATRAGDVRRRRRLAQLGVPLLVAADISELLYELQSPDFTSFNHDDWGLADADLLQVETASSSISRRLARAVNVGVADEGFDTTDLAERAFLPFDDLQDSAALSWRDASLVRSWRPEAAGAMMRRPAPSPDGLSPFWVRVVCRAEGADVELSLRVGARYLSRATAFADEGDWQEIVLRAADHGGAAQLVLACAHAGAELHVRSADVLWASVEDGPFTKVLAA